MWQNKFKQVKQTSTLSDILGSSRKDVIEELSNVSIAMKAFTMEEDDHYKDSECSEDFLFSDEAYTQFMKFLDSGKGNPDPWKDPEEYVNIEDYIVPLRLANILRQLLSRNGDISAKSMLSPMARLYLFMALYECIYSMTNTRVVDISKDLLLKWWTCLKMLQTTGFEIQFAFNHLKRVADAYFGLCVEKRVDKIDNDIFELHKDLQNLQIKIKALEKEHGLVSMSRVPSDPLIRNDCQGEACQTVSRKIPDDRWVPDDLRYLTTH
ncbi:hypothetical protein CMV_015745 [Castanea mollissima]|uniref:Uncharacterized protein n=1 Tax=Castanea mollissima TaxID=60419 RepID=A0A8J4R9H9_9ROSI|nr:hypothetical protein CMV_015745 [Castanea mollissima]